MGYIRSWLWKNTLATTADDEYEEQRTMLRDSYLSARTNITEILDKIRGDFPNLTMHDISHVDSLWDIASVIIGDNYSITPLEGYVLGCSFLIHDAALSYDAFGGKDMLRETTEWKDCFADTKRDSSKTEDEQQQAADFWAVRLLHAQQSTTILDRLFTRVDGSTFYIIEDSNLRDHLKKLIGEIACSHHWDISDVSLKLSTQENALPPFPRQWRINAQKLACIIRCADAAHLDNGRAPDYLFHILNLNGISYDHWSAQNRLAQIDNDTNKPHQAIITSTIDFCENDFNAWNVAFDAITVLNNEIKSSNRLLSNIASDLCFNIREITGAYSREELSAYVRTSGWTPCDANIHISNVASLINNLGGSKLYGNEDHLVIVLRELIQNARDAVKARENFEDGFHNGSIKIKIDQKEEEVLFSVSDNGIGMSRQTITNFLLNFGTSFWGSDLAKKEFSGLRASNFRSVGRFGIGFYSVFMVSNYVTVQSRRYDSGIEKITQLKFPNGLTLSPIVSEQRGESDVSTKITYSVNIEKYSELYTIKRSVSGESNFTVPFSKVISALCAGLDVDVYYQHNDNPAEKIHQNIEDPNLDKCQWLKDISYAEYQNDMSLIDYINDNHQRLEYIKENNRIVGLAAMHIGGIIKGSKYNSLSNKTVGGLCTPVSASETSHYIGYMDYESASAKRESSNICRASKETLHDWALEQFNTIKMTGYPNLANLFFPFTLHNYGIDPISKALINLSTKQGLTKCLTIDRIVDDISKGLRVIVLKSSIIDNCVDLYYNKEKVLLAMQQNDLLCHWAGRGGFDNLKITNGQPDDPHSLMGCIWRCAESKEVSITSVEVQNFAQSQLGGMSHAIIIYSA